MIAINGNFYILITFVIAYGVRTVGMAQKSVLLAVLVGSLFMVPALLGAAAISDRIGRRGIYMAGAILLGIFSFAFFPMVATGSAFMVTAAIAIGLVLLSLMYGPQGAFFAELFSAKVRYSGASLGYQLGAILGGGFAPIIATALLAKYGSSVPISIYMAGMCAVSLLSVYLLSETYKNEDEV